MPIDIPPEKDGLVPTLNHMGWMTVGLDQFSRSFVDFAPHAPGPVLDIGAAYGIASLAALKNGATVIANDLDARHLELLEKNTPKNHRSRLSLMAGAFPENISFADHTLGAVLICRVLHFFDGPTIEKSIAKLFRWLKSGGKVFAIGETVYLKNMQGFIPLYENRLKNPDDAWPGYFENVHEICDPDVKDALPPQIHFFDLNTLTRCFEKAGFTIEKAAIFGRPEYPEWARLDGRESAGIIAIKP